MVKSKLKILIIEPAGNLWGSEKVLLDTLRSEAVTQYEIGVCCPAGSEIIPYLEELTVDIFPDFIANLHLKGRSARLRVLLRMLGVILRFMPDLIYVNQAGATRLALWAARPFRIPVISHVRLAEDVAYISALKASVQHLPAVICVSQYIKDLFDKLDASLYERLFQIYDPYHLNDLSDYQDSNGVDKDTAAFSCVGRLCHGKGQDLVLHALAKLKQDGFDAHCDFWGAAEADRAYPETLKQLAVELDVSENVIWQGFSKEVMSFISQNVAQIVPSRQEPLGRVVFEAWDAGIVPIAWKGSGGPAEVISASGAGILFDQQCGDSLADAMLQVMRMSIEERRQKVEKGRSWVRENCDPEYYTAVLFEIFSKAVAGFPAGMGVK